MKQSVFLEELKVCINRTAHYKNPKITANVIYFMTKQYPIISSNQKTYIKILKDIKTHLVSNFGWSMVDTHRCFCALHKLLKLF